MTAFELSVLDALQGIRCGFLDTFFSTITHLGDAGIFWILLTLALLCTKKYRRAGIAMACALVLDLICCNIVLKPLVARVRPFDMREVELLVARPRGWSFPSGHAAASFTAVGALYASGEKLWRPAAVLALLIAFSRLYLYVHYPTDVLAGIVLGTVLGFVGQHLAAWAEARLKARRV